MKKTILFLFFLSCSALWAIGGKTLKVPDNEFPAYTCRLDLVSNIVNNGAVEDKMNFPCSSVIIEKNQKELKILTAAHCLVNFDIDSAGRKIYYHYSEPKRLSCPTRIDGKKVYYTDYNIANYSFIYDKRYLENKSVISSLEYHSDKENTGPIYFCLLGSNKEQALSNIPVNDVNYFLYLKKMLSLDLAILTIKTDKDPYLLETAKMSENLSSIAQFEKCRIAGYSEKNNKLNLGEISSVNANKNIVDKKGFWNVLRRKQESWIKGGDSGGPLYCEQSNPSWSVVGLASNSQSIIGQPSLLYWTLVDKMIIKAVLEDTDHTVKIEK